jgi:hypothetical protein
VWQKHEDNKRIVTEFYRKALFEGDVDAAVRLYGGIPSAAAATLEGLIGRAKKAPPETAAHRGRLVALPRYLLEVAGLPLKVACGGSRKTSFMWSSLSTTNHKIELIIFLHQTSADGLSSCGFL